jgi:hypothetical protein
MKRTQIEKFGSEFDRRVKGMQATTAPAGTSPTEFDKRVAAIDAFAMPVIGMPARSLAELAIKAKVALWFSGDSLSEDTPSEAAAASIIRDLLALDKAS